MFGSPWIVDYLLEFNPYEICNIPRVLRFVKDFDGEKEITDNFEITLADSRSTIKSFFNKSLKEQGLSTLKTSNVNNYLICVKRYCYLYSDSKLATSSNNEILLVILDFAIQPTEDNFFQNDLTSCMEIANLLQKMKDHIRYNPKMVLEKENYPDFSIIETLNFDTFVAKQNIKVACNCKQQASQLTILQFARKPLSNILHKDIDWCDSDDAKINRTIISENSDDVESMIHKTDVSFVNKVSSLPRFINLNCPNSNEFEISYPYIKLTHIKKRIDFGIQTDYNRRHFEMKEYQSLVLDDDSYDELLRWKLQLLEGSKNQETNPYDSANDGDLDESFQRSFDGIESEGEEETGSDLVKSNYWFTDLINKINFNSDVDVAVIESKLASRRSQAVNSTPKVSESNMIEIGEFMDNENCFSPITFHQDAFSDPNIDSPYDLMNSKDRCSKSNVDLNEDEERNGRYVSMVNDVLFDTSASMDSVDIPLENIEGKTLFQPMLTEQSIRDYRNSRCISNKTSSGNPDTSSNSHHIVTHTSMLSDLTNFNCNMQYTKLFRPITTPFFNNSLNFPKRKISSNRGSNDKPYICVSNEPISHHFNEHLSSYPTPKNSFPAYQQPKLKSLSMKQKPKDVLAELDNIIYEGSSGKTLLSDFEIPDDIKIWCYNYFKNKNRALL